MSNSENKTGFDSELKGLSDAIRKQLTVLTEQLNADTERLLEYKKEHGNYFYRTGNGEEVAEIQLIPHIERCRLSIKSALESVSQIIKIQKEAEKEDDGSDDKKPFDAREAFKTPRKDL